MKSPSVFPEVNLPFSKSISNRWLILSRMSGGLIEIQHLSDSTDTRRLKSLLETDGPDYDAGDGGTTFRFLLAYLSWKQGAHKLSGSDRMGIRPMKELVDALCALGASIQPAGNESPFPIIIRGGNLRGGTIALDGSRSSQFLSSLLLIAPFLTEPLTIRLTGEIVSRPYIEMTLAILTKAGVRWERCENEISVWPSSIVAQRVVVERDWSSAAFFYQYISLVEGSALRLPGLTRSGIQGDEKLAEYFAQLGVQTIETEAGVELRHFGYLVHQAAMQFDMTDCPDITPSLVMACAGLRQPSRFFGISHLRNKESDRIEILSKYLRVAGCEVETSPDSIQLKGFPDHFHYLDVDPCHDHRIAMSMAVFSAAGCHVHVHDSGTVAKSFPDFWSAVSRLDLDVTRD